MPDYVTPDGVSMSGAPAVDPNAAFHTQMSPVVPATIPTKAPTVSSPISTVSSNTAINHINDVIVPAMNQASQTLADYQAQRKLTTIDKKTNADGTSNLFMSDGSRVKTDANGFILPQTTPEQQIADTPDAGYKFVYSQDGSRTQIPLTDNASSYGMLDNNPTVAPIKPVLSSAELPSGTSIKQYSDGTYGMFDVQGKYIGNATQTQYQNAKNGQDVLDKLNQAVNGNYPLTSNQQAQIDAIKQYYQELTKKQETANANYTGGTTVAQNLYGIGNTIMAQGQIKGVIDEGISKITDIQSRMNSDVAKMTQAFQEGNITSLKDAYTAFSSNQKALQDSLNKVHDDTAQIVKDHKAQEAAAILQVDNDIRGLQNELLKSPGTTASQKQAIQLALANHDYDAAFKAAGDSLETAPGWMGDYFAYKKDAIAHGQNPMSPIEYKNWDDTNVAKANAAAKAALEGIDGSGVAQGTNIPFQSTIDSALNGVSNASRGPLKGELYNLAVKGDYVSLLNRVEQNAKQNLTAQNRAIVEGEQAALPYLDQLNAKLKQYQAMGGDMGYVKGTEGQVAKNFGQLATDPKFASIAAELQIMFQKYRKEMTGAAFSAAESRDYASVVPTGNKNLDLNFALLEGLRNSKQAGVDNAYSSLLPAGSYLSLKSKADEQLYGTKDTTHPLVQDENKAIDTLTKFKEQNPDKAQKMQNDIQVMEKTTGKPMNAQDFLQAFPEYGKVSFNTVGGDTNQATIPSGTLASKNNNPGNLRYVGQAGAIQGEGGFAKFASVEQGLQALTNQIRLDAERGHTLASFIAKFAPPSENDTARYIAQIMKAVGANRDTKLADIDPKILTKAMAMKESGTKIT